MSESVKAWVPKSDDTGDIYIGCIRRDKSMAEVQASMLNKALVGKISVVPVLITEAKE